ncbi:MAG: DUF4197 domain-containing protein [Candidatus Binatia bacterium]
MSKVFAVTLFLLSSVVPAWAQLDRVLEGLGVGRQSGSGLSDSKVASGLKEALKVGTENAVRLTGRTDGYFRNEAIKILMPKGLRNLEQPLRAIGYGPKVDEFVLSMNRAAERAAPFAKEIFWNAITQMSFDDARKILTGNDTAATDYFKNKTSDRLATAFRPTVEKSMNEVGVTKQYKELVGRYEGIPFAKSVAFDLDDYVVTKAIDGLFLVVGQEEKKIRKDPAARVTDLLKEVFAK